MKRHQQRSKPLQPPMFARSSRSIQQKSVAKFSLGTGWTQPLVILGGAWVVVLLVALTAVSGLLSPDSSNGKSTTGAAILRNTAETAQMSKRQNRLPLWLFGAIALSCAAGSMLVSKQVTRPPRSHTRPQRSTKPKHLTPSPAPVGPEPLEPSLQPTSHPSTPATMPSFALTPRHPQTAEAAPVTLMQLAQMPLTQAATMSAVGQPTVVPVTVVPPEEKAPLDWGEASLADKLDLRKQRSMSSLL